MQVLHVHKGLCWWIIFQQLPLIIELECAYVNIFLQYISNDIFDNDMKIYLKFWNLLSSMKAMAKLNELKWEMVHYSLYSPDLFPSNITICFLIWWHGFRIKDLHQVMMCNGALE